MGKKFLATMIVAVVAVVSGYNVYQSQSKVVLSELALANVEALATGEDGTNAGYCFTQVVSGRSGYKIFCDSKTSDNKIYPCSSSETFGSYSESKDRCTK